MREQTHRRVDLVQAARIVLGKYPGDAGRTWSDEPTAAVLRKRL